MTKGDMGIAGPAAFVALNELEAIRNSLDEIFSLQDTTTGPHALGRHASSKAASTNMGHSVQASRSLWAHRPSAAQ